MEEDILGCVRKFCRLLKDEGQQDTSLGRAGWSSSQDIAVLAGHLSFDVMSQVCFGDMSNMLQRKDDRYILDVISNGAQALNTVCNKTIGPDVS